MSSRRTRYDHDELSNPSFLRSANLNYVKDVPQVLEFPLAANMISSETTSGQLHRHDHGTTILRIHVHNAQGSWLSRKMHRHFDTGTIADSIKHVILQQDATDTSPIFSDLGT